MWPEFYYITKEICFYRLLLLEDEKSLENRVFNDFIFLCNKINTYFILPLYGKINIKLQR